MSEHDETRALDDVMRVIGERVLLHPSIAALWVTEWTVDDAQAVRTAVIQYRRAGEKPLAEALRRYTNDDHLRVDYPGSSVRNRHRKDCRACQTTAALAAYDCELAALDALLAAQTP